jgi:multimeric flavodoxin WrbA
VNGLLNELSELVEPVHAESFFSVSRTGEIHERLSYEYADAEGYYRKVVRDQNLLAKEVQKLAANMQFYLDKERVEINFPRVQQR